MQGRAGWLAPHWPAPANVHAVCSSRAGGQSLPPYESLNLGDHVGDAPTAVAYNRKAFAAALGARPVFLEQVHGLHTVELDAGTPDGTQADGCFTAQPGVACTIMVADCLPVLLCDEAGTAVAAAHAGWRGLAGGILEQVLERFWPVARIQHAPAASKTIAWLGPCIGPEAFEVGPEVKAAFERQDPRSAALFRPHGQGKFLADLPGLARQRLQAQGITRIHGNDGSRAWCTASNPSRFFSHRRDGVSGRLAASIWLG
jgi:YfiH family protein